MADDEPRRRYSNGHISEVLSTRLLQCLSETDIDKWSEPERREMKANLIWVSEHRRTLGSRQRLRATIYAAALAVAVGFISWLSPWNVRTTLICPSGYVCTQSPITTPVP